MIQKSQLVTHNGSFPADEVTAVAWLQLYRIVKDNQLEIIRRRDIERVIIKDYNTCVANCNLGCCAAITKF